MASRPTISWADLHHATVGVWGLGVEGAANVRKLRELEATMVLVDDHPVGAPVDGLEVMTTDRGGLEALTRCDAVVKTPGISRYRTEIGKLTSLGVPLVGGLGLWMQGADRSKVAAVTGTKGKSTTSALCGHLLQRLGVDSAVGGNLGRPPWDPEVAAAVPDDAVWIVEVSSFQATDLGASPPVVAVTALHPDHLDWHGDAETYYRDKLSACRQPGAELTIADGDSELLRSRRHLLGPEVRWVRSDDPELDGEWVDALGLMGMHNRRNALIARAILEALRIPEAGDDEALAGVARDFAPLESRFQPAGRVGGVDFVDDSLSTNVLPTLAALEATGDRRVALLVGGHDRGIDYEPLAGGIVARPWPTLVVTLPGAGDRIHRALEERLVAGGGGETGQVEVIDRPALEPAVAAAYEWARPDGVVLLSPAAPSFGEFRDYRERAAAFRRAMDRCREA